MEKKIEHIIQQMMIEEKEMLLTGIDDVHTKSFEKYGVQFMMLLKR